MALTTEDVLTLARAGFTAEQIAEFNAALAPVTVTSGPVSSPTAAPEPAQAPEPAPAPATAPGDTREILQALKDLTSAIQLGNIRQNGPGPQGPETVEQVLASIINP